MSNPVAAILDREDYEPHFLGQFASSRSSLAGMKRLLDVTVSGLLLLVGAPVIFVSMLLVRFSSKGPVIYAQVRLGRHGRPFVMYKIRTMHHECEKVTGPKWATPNDPRVFLFGRFLRATHIDELPQLWNVLRGEMSMVGPRPERPAIARQLRRVLPLFDERLRVLPGLTGLAQIQLPPDQYLDDVRHKLECDLHYMNRASVWLDLRILFCTAMGVLMVPFNLSGFMLRLPRASDIQATHGSFSPSARGDGADGAPPEAAANGDGGLLGGPLAGFVHGSGLPSRASAN